MRISEDLNNRIIEVVKKSAEPYKKVLAATSFSELRRDAILVLERLYSRGVFNDEVSETSLDLLSQQAIIVTFKMKFPEMVEEANEIFKKEAEEEQRNAKEKSKEEEEKPSSTRKSTLAYSKPQIISMSSALTNLIKDNLGKYRKIVNNTYGYKGQKRKINIYAKEYLAESKESPKDLDALEEANAFIKKLEEELIGSFSIEYGFELVVENKEAPEGVNPPTNDDMKDILDTIRDEVVELINKSTFTDSNTSYKLEAVAGRDNKPLSPLKGRFYIEVTRRDLEGKKVAKHSTGSKTSIGSGLLKLFTHG